jgi:hypothetical protein
MYAHVHIYINFNILTCLIISKCDLDKVFFNRVEFNKL